MPIRRNVPALGYRLSPAERTLGEAIGACGYGTAYIGKWHLYSAYGVSGGLNLSQAARSPVPASHRRGFDRWLGFELRNDFYDSWVFHDDAPQPTRLQGHQTDALFDLALDQVAAAADGERPFFLILSVEAPHPPFMATPRTSGPGAGPRALAAASEHRSRRRSSSFRRNGTRPTGPAGAIDPADPASVTPGVPGQHAGLLRDDRADRRQHGPARRGIVGEPA